ncbi:DNA-dependent metalloprotease SPRTN-like [Gigantopelta aegis]|uniref:DNA-dependent metalloprotease SPRTN-like n=1 Tax=Gigantopelta aegis TaxID=1735272 RepID=UPI001B88A662|nr:DNA-dependent metalloprotease SPRTN-like [Gigantopelta aegis]
MDGNGWDAKSDDMDIDDFSIALRLQEQFDREISESFVKSSSLLTAEKTELSLIDPQWELTDPNPDIRALFLQYNDRFFEGRLSGIEVKWSPRMTLCAGLCCYEGRGGLCSVRLSLPLLRLRPRKDLVETLLHEMIHAYLFVTDNNKDHDGHGPEFHKHMHRINKESGTKITIYHTFNDEVDSYRQHWWRCNGPCQQRRPYFGYVKRSMNRAPSSRDPWWGEHQRSCGGTYIKVKEPEGYGQKKKSKGESSVKNATKNTNDDADSNGTDIRSFLSGSSKTKTGGKNKEHKIKKLPNDSDNDSANSLDDWFSDDFDLKPASSKPKSSNTSNRWIPKPQSGLVNIHTISNKSHVTENATKSTKSSTNNGRIQTIWDTMDVSDDAGSSSGEISDMNQTNGDSCKQSSWNVSGSGQTLGASADGNSFLALERKKLTEASQSSFGSFALNNGIEIEAPKRKIESNSSIAVILSDSEDDSSEIKPLRKKLKVSSLTKNAGNKTHATKSTQNIKQNKENENNYGSNMDIRRLMSPGKAGPSMVEAAHPCPVCKTRIPDSQINSHLDQCLSWQ